MSSNAVFNIIDRVANASGTKDKKSILASACFEKEDLKYCLLLAYSPFCTYGITVSPGVYGTDGGKEFDVFTHQLLSRLMKRDLTGHAAHEAISDELATLSPCSAQLLVRIINKDMRAGISESTINSVFPGLIPEAPYMRCILSKAAKNDKFNWEEGVYSQLKADGMFANCTVTESGAVFTSRQGHQILVPIELSNAAGETFTPGTVSMGELLVTKGGNVLPRKDGNALINNGDLDGCEVRYVVWDQVPIECWVPGGRCDTKYMVRYASLYAQVVNGPHKQIKMIGTKLVHSYVEARAHAMEFQRQGLEGSVYKDPHAPWIDGTSPWQVKLKVEFVVDLEIIGFTVGKGKRAKDFGALVCATSDRLLQVDVAGLKEADYARINDDRESYLGTIVAVAANDISEVDEVASLMHPRVAEFRKDKVVADTLQQVRDQLESARNGG